jgi:signal transduction histidine kinase
MSTLTSQAAPRTAAGTRTRAGAWYVGTALYVALACAWLLIGLAAALTAHVPALREWASAAAAGRHGSAWTSTGRGLVAGAADSYPVLAVVLDYVFSAVNLLIATALLRFPRPDRTARLLALGTVGFSGAFNLQAHTAIETVAASTGVQIGWWHTALLHGVGGAAFLLALLLFPTGSLAWDGRLGRTARSVVLLAIAGVAALLGVSTAEIPHTISFLLFFGLLTPLAGGAAQWVHYTRAATAEARQQSRILLWALGLCFAAAVALAAITLTTQLMHTPGLPAQTTGVTAQTPGMTGGLSGLGGLGTQAVAFWIFRVLFTVVPGAVLVGVLRYRLSSFELFFNRALVYGVLVVLIGSAYVFGVVRVDALFGLNSDWLAPPQVAAAGLVALAFHPVRLRLERWADRLVYGRRVAPYDVLAQVSALSRASEPGATTLDSLARITAQGLRTGYATVYLELQDGTQTEYRWPSNAATAASTAERRIPVTYRGEAVGALGIPADNPGRPARGHALLDHLTGAAGVVMHNARLSIELEHRLHATELRTAEIRASRWRIVAAQDSERRELERDLHDGAQPGLTAVRLSLGLAAHLAQSGNRAAREALGRLRTQIDNASVSLRQTLRGLDPPALGEHGVTRALHELAEALGTAAQFRVGAETRSARFASDIEAAVYFCCAEALQNTVKHCPGAAVSVTLDLDRDAGLLRFTVADRGPGFDAAVSTGSGMQNMADRIAAAGGVLRIESRTGEGTEVSGSVPTAPAAEQPAIGRALERA